MTIEAQASEALKSAFGDLEFIVTVKGVKREDGRTAAEVEAALERGEE